MTLADTTHSRDYITLKERVEEDYARELVVESAIDPAVALERGYWVAIEKLDLKPLGFTRTYRRIEVPALVIPRRSPDGATTRYQIKPRIPMQTEWGKYLFPHDEEMIVDVHPRSLENLKDPSVPLWVTEGSKGGDSLVSQDLCAVALAGVYNFAVKDTHSRTLLPCWDHINLEGRKVIVAHDADAQSSEHVQEALNRLVIRLAERGASVLVTYIPPVGGDGKAGVDDFLANGGHPHDLLAQAVPFVPTDVSHERLARDPVLKEHIEWMEESLLRENWSRRGVARKVLKALILTSRRQGTMWETHFLNEDGSRYEAQCILMRRAYRTLAEDVGVSLSSVTRGIETLEKMGIIQRDYSLPRKYDEPMWFLLLSGLLWDRYKGTGCTTNSSISEIFSSHPFVPISQHNLRLRNSSPLLLRQEGSHQEDLQGQAVPPSRGQGIHPEAWCPRRGDPGCP
jgi:GNAT superfamily N-acetyltransferase